MWSAHRADDGTVVRRQARNRMKSAVTAHQPWRVALGDGPAYHSVHWHGGRGILRLAGAWGLVELRRCGEAIGEE